MLDPILGKARALWEQLAAAPVSFPARGDVTVTVSPGSGLCPTGWTGIVMLDGSAIATAPTAAAAAALRAAAAKLRSADMIDPDALGRLLPLAEVSGPATLSYLDPDRFRPATSSAPIVELPNTHSELRRLAMSAPEQEVEESSLRDITSPAFIIRDNGQPVAAAGYRSWPGQTAHLSVLTTPLWRRRGLAKVAGSAAVAHALAANLLPQWRSGPVESTKVARALGFRELGSQLSIRLA